jgi:hypothetical protein
MSSAPRLTQAGLVAALLSLVALSCGSDLVDLLPPSPAAAGSAAAGNEGKAGSESAGTGSGGHDTEGGSTAHQGGFGGTAQSGGNAGGNTGGVCFGFACPTAGQSNSGGSLGYPVQCADKGQCKPGYNCDRFVGRCGPICTDTSDCENGRVCDTDQSVCVPCIDSPGVCQDDFHPEARVCYLRRCVECVTSNDCPQGERDVCNRDFECVECVSDLDCKANDNGKDHCDVPRERCE